MNDSNKMKQIIDNIDIDDSTIKHIVKSLLGFATTEYQTGLNYDLEKKLKTLVDKEAQKRIQ